MKLINPGKLLTAVALVATMASAQAQILFNDGTGNSSSTQAYNADTGSINQTMAGNVFTPTLSGTANEITFSGVYTEENLPTDSFIISLYSTSLGAPDSVLYTSTLSDFSRTDTDTEAFGYDEIYNYSGILNTPFTLSNNTSYYIGISDTTKPLGAFAVLQTATPGPATSEYSYTLQDNFGGGAPVSLAFSLSEVAVPEPSTYVLTAFGLGVLLLVSRSRRSAAV